MNATRKCERCGQDLGDAIAGTICPACIAQMGSASWLQAPGSELPPNEGDNINVLPEVDSPGSQIGRYRLLQKIGEGGFGVVYLAEQVEPVKRKVALKIIKAGMDTKEVIARFEAERQALALMDHPNIAKVHDAGATENGRPYFMMELVQGVPITDYCDQCHLATRERLELFITVCQAVQHAHQKGVIHRDLKPSNVMVAMQDGRPSPKIIDFGVAKAINQRLTEHTLVTAFAQMVGTPMYMSPEQAELSPLGVDTRSDIYSLGVLLYQLLTSTTPFDAKRLKTAAYDELRRIIREEEPPRPSVRISTLKAAQATTVAGHHRTDSRHLIQTVRGDLDWIVMKAIEKDRTRRYETASELAMDVQRHLGSEPVLARPPSKLYEFQKTVRRHKLGFGATAALILVLLVGVLVSTLEAIRATRAEREQSRLRHEAEQARTAEARLRQEAETRELDSRQQAYVSDMAAAHAAVSQGNLGLARGLLDRHGPRPGQEDLRGFEWRYLWGLCRGEQVRSFIDSSPVGCVAYSPDGTLLASGGGEPLATAGGRHDVSIWNVETGQLIATCAGHSQQIISVAFSPDGKLLASGGADGLVRFWDVGGWQNVLTITNPTPYLAFSGRLLAIATGGNCFGTDGGRVVLWDYVVGRQLASLPMSGNRAAFSADGKTLATANWNGEVKLWDVETRRVLKAVPGKLVVSMAFSPDGMWLAWCSDDRTVHLWNLSEAQPTILEQKTSYKINSVAFSPNGRMLATANGAGGHIVLWDVHTRKRLETLRGHSGHVAAVTFSPDGRMLASAGDHTIRLWDPRPRRPGRSIPDVTYEDWHSVGRPIFSPDGSVVAAASTTQGIQVWDVASCEVVARLATNHLPASFSSDGHTLLVIDRDSSLIEEWDISAGTFQGAVRLSPITDPTNWYADAFSFEANLIASAHPNGVILRSAATGEVNLTLTNLARTRSLAFSRDGGLLATGHWDGTAELWNTATGDVVLRVAGFHDAVCGFAFSRDDRLLAVASWDASIGVFEIASNRRLMTLHGHLSATGPPAFSDDGKTLASTGSDGVKLWHLATGREIYTLHPSSSASAGGYSEIAALSFSPDGRTLMTRTLGGSMELWRAPSLVEIDRN